MASGAGMPPDSVDAKYLDTLFGRYNDDKNSPKRRLDDAATAASVLARGIANAVRGDGTWADDPNTLDGIVNGLMAKWSGPAAEEFQRQANLVRQFALRLAGNCSVADALPTVSAGDQYWIDKSRSFMRVIQDAKGDLENCVDQWNQLQSDVDRWVNDVISLAGRYADDPRHIAKANAVSGNGMQSYQGRILSFVTKNLLGADTFNVYIQYYDNPSLDRPFYIRYDDTDGNAREGIGWQPIRGHWIGCADDYKNWLRNRVRDPVNARYMKAYVARIQQILAPVSTDFRQQLPTLLPAKLDDSQLPGQSGADGGYDPGGYPGFNPAGLSDGLGGGDDGYPDDLDGLGDTNGLGNTDGTGGGNPTGPPPESSFDPSLTPLGADVPTSLAGFDPGGLGGAGGWGGPTGLGAGAGPGGVPGMSGAGAPSGAAGTPAAAGAAADQALAGRGMMPMMPMMPMAGGGEGGKQRSRASWLAEDESTWMSDDDAAPPVI